ncbi:MAG: two-component system sensor histidine kinase NtrB [Planctomycetota bacterium]|jgi:signal transduction histidine kinase
MLDSIAKLLKHICDAVIAVDEGKKVVALVPEPLDILGTPPILRGEPLPAHVAVRFPVDSLFYCEDDFIRFPVAHGNKRFELSAVPFEWKDKPKTVFLLVRDVTEEISRERKLIAQEKMAAVGLLAAGVAHEFNNIIGAISGHAQMAKRDEKFREKLIDVVVREVAAAQEITKNLLSFSRFRPYVQQMGLITEVIDSVVELIEPELVRNNISVERDYKKAPETLLSRGGMEQVFLNLLLNAVEAIDRNGSISIHVESDGDMIIVKVTDTGRGIPPEHIGRVFEPFFTTKTRTDEKEREPATGLGLAVSYNLVRDHRGEITVESEPGKGSAFTIRLPVRKERRRRRVKVSKERRASELMPSPAKILIVDDEPYILEFLSQLLVRHEVVTARTGEEALDVFRSESFDACILDLKLGSEVDGIEVFRALREENPDCRIYIMSGYPVASEDREELERAHGFIVKPFDLVEVENLISGITRRGS